MYDSMQKDQERLEATEVTEVNSSLNERLETLNKILADTCAVCDRIFGEGKATKSSVSEAGGRLDLAYVLTKDALENARYIMNRVHDAADLIG